MVNKVKTGKREKAWKDFKTILFKEDPGRLEKANWSDQTNSAERQRRRKSALVLSKPGQGLQ